MSRPAAFDHLMSTGGQSGLRLLRPDKGAPTARGRAAGPGQNPGGRSPGRPGKGPLAGRGAALPFDLPETAAGPGQGTAQCGPLRQRGAGQGQSEGCPISERAQHPPPPGPVPHGWAHILAASLRLQWNLTGRGRRAAAGCRGSAGVGRRRLPWAVAPLSARALTPASWAPTPSGTAGARSSGEPDSTWRCVPVRLRVTCQHTQMSPQTCETTHSLGRCLV